MAVRERDNGKWLYEFEVGAKRYRKVFDAKSEAAARRIEDAAKKAARADLAEQAKVTRNASDAVSLVIADAFELYYKQRTLGGSLQEPKTTPRSADLVQVRDGLCMMFDYFSRRTPPIRLLTQIDDNVLLDLIQWRAGHCRWGTIENNYKTAYGPISAATVNRTVTQVLQRVFTHARETWRLELPRAPRFGKARMQESDRRLRTLSIPEFARIRDVCPEGYMEQFLFSVSSCLRQEESLPRWNDIDLDRQVLKVVIKGSRRVQHPLTAANCRLIESLRGHHDEYVFTSIADRTTRTRRKGQRYPITVDGIQNRFPGICAKAGVEDYHWHDNRRTGASWWARLKGVQYAQLMLHHKDITTTMRYLGDVESQLIANIDHVDEAFAAELAAYDTALKLPAPARRLAA